MKILFITLSATLGILGALVAEAFWVYNYRGYGSGSYNAFSWPNGWFWPLLVSILLCCALVVGFKSCSGFEFEFKEVFFKILLPYAIGAVSILAITILVITIVKIIR